jgi:hypothetical protein
MVATDELTGGQDKRSRFRLSLRVLFAVMSAAAIVFLVLPGWWARAMERPGGADRLLFLLGTLGLVGTPMVLLLFVYGRRLGIRPGEISIGMSLTILTLTTATVAMHPMFWFSSWLPLSISILLFAVGTGCAIDRAKSLRERSAAVAMFGLALICLLVTAGIGLSILTHQHAWHVRDPTRPPVATYQWALFAASWLVPGIIFSLGIRIGTGWSIQRSILWGAAMFTVSPVAFLVLGLLGGPFAGN